MAVVARFAVEKDQFAMIDPRVASGLRDLLPAQMIARERALASFRQTLASFGFVPIETPHIERMEVLTGKGAGSDEVLRQIYEVTNKGGERGELGLRFDLTVPLARFVARNIQELGRPFKRYAVGSVFRGERPAKGRFREFLQCDFDVVGTESLVSDAEIVQVVHDTLSAIGVPPFTIVLNHRKILDGLFRSLGLVDRSASLLRSLDKLSKIGRAGVFDEMLARGATLEDAAAGTISTDQANLILDFVAVGQGGIEVLDQVAAGLPDQQPTLAAIDDLRRLFAWVQAGGVPANRLKIDVGLARGLDYYTGIVLETTVDGWEKFGSVASGGRYDNLTRLFTDQALPGVGASIGLDRLLALLDEAGATRGPAISAPVLIPRFPEVSPMILLDLATRLRAVGIGAEVYPDAIQTGKQLQYGSARGHRFAVIVGPDEVAADEFNLRDLATRAERKKLPLADLESTPPRRRGGIDQRIGSEPMTPPPPRESSVPLVKGTVDRLPAEFSRLARLERELLATFARVGYDRLATPVLEPVELHERKSGAGIVSKLFLVSGTASPRVCLRPELTAGVVRAYTATEPPPALPWRVSHAGSAFRHEDPARPDRLREFHQVGLERLGDSGPFADAEVIWLAVSALTEVGIPAPAIRVGHVGLILELLTRSGLPTSAQTALIEILSEAAAEGGDVGSIERGLDHFEGWLRQATDPTESSIPRSATDDPGIDRLFRTLVPVVTGRRSSQEIVARLRGKWELNQELADKLGLVRRQVQTLAQLRGSPPVVLDRLTRDFAAWAPESVASLRSLFESLRHHGVDTDSIVLDLGLGRGIGFYSQMIFDLTVATPEGVVELGGGGRYDGLARVFGSDRDDRGVGFAFGLERIDQILQAKSAGNRSPEPFLARSALVIPATTDSISSAVKLAAQIRARGGRAILESGWEPTEMSERAQALGARWSVVVTAAGVAEPTLSLYDHLQGTKRPGTSAEVPRIIADQPREALA